MIPGRALEIRYRRTDGHRYRHAFRQPVRMETNADGSVTLRGRARVWADDREAGFARYLENPGRKRPVTIARLGIWLLKRDPSGTIGLYQKAGRQKARRWDTFTDLSRAAAALKIMADRANPVTLSPRRLAMRYLPGTALNPRHRSGRRRHGARGGGGSMTTYLLLGGLAYLLLARRPAAAAPAATATGTNPFGVLIQNLVGALGSGLALGPGEPIVYWINPATQEFQTIPGGTTVPPAIGWRPASEWEIGQYGVFS